MQIQIATDKPTVQKLVEAAIPLFAMKGVAAVSVKELAEAAGVNVALISYYFGGKDNFYAFVLEQQLMVLDDILEKINAAETCPVKKIRCFARAAAANHKENPYLDRLFYSEIINPTKCFDSVVVKAANKLDVFLINCINDAMAAGLFRKDLKPHLAAVALIKILNLSFIRILLSKEYWSGDDLIETYSDQALDIYLRGVAAI